VANVGVFFARPRAFFEALEPDVNPLSVNSLGRSTANVAFVGAKGVRAANPQDSSRRRCGKRKGVTGIPGAWSGLSIVLPTYNELDPTFERILPSANCRSSNGSSSEICLLIDVQADRPRGFRASWGHQAGLRFACHPQGGDAGGWASAIKEAFSTHRLMWWSFLDQRRPSMRPTAIGNGVRQLGSTVAADLVIGSRFIAEAASLPQAAKRDPSIPPGPMAWGPLFS